MEDKIRIYREGQSGVIDRTRKIASQGVYFRLLILRLLPMGFFTGLKVEALDDNKCSVSVSSGWLNNNPFRSTYFAVLAMAAEMSTGLPAFSYTWKSSTPISMLITGMTASFTKKAIGITTFTFSQPQQMLDAIEKAILSGEGTSVDCISIGTSKEGVEVARFTFTWSFRVKAKK